MLEYTFSLEDKINALNERVDYYIREVLYGKSLSESFKNSDRESLEYYSLLIDHLVNLENWLAEIGQQIKDLDTNDEQKFYPDFQRLKRTLILIPKAIHNLVISALQRKYRPIRYFAFAAFPTYSFGESHPTYSAEIKALEKINRYFGSIINRTSSLFTIPVPIICLSDHGRYARSKIRVDVDRDLPEELAAVEIPAILHQRLRNHFTLSNINMPRWGPCGIRFGVFIAHEHMHHLIDVLNFTYKFITKRMPGNAYIPSEVKDKFGTYFGEGLCDLTIAHRNCLEQFRKGFANASTGQTKAEESQNSEFICDIGATAMVGPAFVYAFIADLLRRNEDCGTDGLKSNHPPSPLRLFLMIQVLDSCGYKESAARIRKYYENSGFESYARERYPEYSKWLYENYTYYWYFIKTFNYYSRQQTVDEGLYFNDCETIIDSLKSNDPYLYDFSAIQILNALWHKINYCPKTPAYHMLWRLALKYCADVH